MRDSHDKKTLTIAGLPMPRGRPATGKAMSAAERQRLYRQKKQREANNQLVRLKNAYDTMSNYEVAKAIKDHIWLSIPGDKLALPALEDARLAWLELGRRNNWL